MKACRKFLDWRMTMPSRQALAYHSCGLSLVAFADHENDSMRFRETTFMSRPIAFCPRCSLQIFDGNVSFPHKNEKKTQPIGEQK
jgi:hypothetical protein